jgi:hypothetical protein
MVDKKLIAAGFGAGVLLGIFALDLRPAQTAADEPPNAVSTMPAESVAGEPSQAERALPLSGANTSQADFDSFVSSFAAANGGKVSLHDLDVLSNIYARAHGIPTGPDSMRSTIQQYPVVEPPASVVGMGAIPMPSIDSGRRIGALGSVVDGYGGSASGRYMDMDPDLSVQRLVPPPVILSPAGPGTYTSTTADVYTQAGPHGVVNTETGEFSPHP